jgi:hypothetical protein
MTEKTSFGKADTKARGQALFDTWDATDRENERAGRGWYRNKITSAQREANKIRGQKLCLAWDAADGKNKAAGGGQPDRKNREGWMNFVILHNSAADALQRKLEHTLTLDDLWVRWDQQGGRCHWFGVPLGSYNDLPFGHPMLPAIDLLEPSAGYITGNFVFTTLMAHLGRGVCGHAEFKRIMGDIYRVEAHIVRDAIP